MTIKEIEENLCHYDPRSPEYKGLINCIGIDDMREPRTDCYCDNCFSGCDVLAVELLKTLDTLYESQLKGL